MDSGCQLIQEVLIEVEGETSRLSEAELRHLDSCASCRALADADDDLILCDSVEDAEPSRRP